MISEMDEDDSGTVDFEVILKIECFYMLRFVPGVCHTDEEEDGRRRGE